MIDRIRRSSQNQRSQWAYLLSMGFFGLATSLFDMYYALHLQSLGLTGTQIGNVFLYGFVTMAVVVLPLSVLADMVGRRSVMVLSSLGFGVTMVVIPFLRTYELQSIAFSINSVCSAVMVATTTAVVARVFTQNERRLWIFKQGFTYFLASSAMGNLLGIATLGLSASGTFQYVPSLVVSGLLAVCIGLSRILVSEPPPDHAQVAEDVSGVRDHVGSIAALLVLASLVGSAGVLAIRFFNLLVVDDFHVDPRYLGYLLALDRAASFVGLFLIFPLMRRRRELRVAGVVMLAALPIQLVSASATTTIAFMLPYLSRQGLHYSQMPVLDLVANRSAPARAQALFNGFERFGIFLGSAICSHFYGLLFEAGRFGTAMVLSGALSFAAGALYLLIDRRQPASARADEPAPAAGGTPR